MFTFFRIFRSTIIRNHHPCLFQVDWNTKRKNKYTASMYLENWVYIGYHRPCLFRTKTNVEVLKYFFKIKKKLIFASKNSFYSLFHPLRDLLLLNFLQKFVFFFVKISLSLHVCKDFFIWLVLLYLGSFFFLLTFSFFRPIHAVNKSKSSFVCHSKSIYVECPRWYVQFSNLNDSLWSV